MKRCPRCNQIYTDNELNFCLNDGELLANHYGDASRSSRADDSPPTLIMDSPRITNPIGWQVNQPIQPWQSPQQSSQNPVYGLPHGFVHSRDQTLPTISLVLGVFSLVLICCYGGIWLGLPAAIVGFLGMKNADGDPMKYGGRGMAIAGMVLGIISFLGAIAFIFFGLLGSIS